MIHIGIVGTGGMAHPHADAFKRLAGEGVDIVACCDNDKNLLP